MSSVFMPAPMRRFPSPRYVDFIARQLTTDAFTDIVIAGAGDKRDIRSAAPGGHRLVGPFSTERHLIMVIACTGDDDIGERIRRQLASDKIDVAPVRAVAGEATGVALIFVNAEGENVIGFSSFLFPGKRATGIRWRMPCFSFFILSLGPLPVRIAYYCLTTSFSSTG